MSEAIQSLQNGLTEGSFQYRGYLKNTMHTTAEKKRFHQVYWAARRGMLELDLFLIPFVENHFSQLSEADKTTLESLLSQADPLLYEWLFQRKTAPATYAALINKIYVYAKNSSRR